MIIKMSKREQLLDMLTPSNWDELQSYVVAAAHNEDGPDRDITDQFWEDAINEIVQENCIMAKIMREDHVKFTDLRKEYEAIQELYLALIMEVGNKFEKETRHETALRYIRQAENQISGPSQEKVIDDPIKKL